MEFFVQSQDGKFQRDRGRGTGGRFGFAAAAMLVIAGILLLLDRAGAPGRLVVALGPLCALAALAVIGVAMRTMLVSQFYAAGRRVPVAYGGLGLAGLAMALALPLLPQPVTLPRLAVLGGGLGGGLLVAAFVSGPLLRKSGAFSVAGLLGARFPGLAFRLASLALVVAIAGLVALAGLALANESLMLASGFARWPCAILLGLAVALLILPGGFSGVVWASAAGACGLGGALAISLGLAGAQHIPLALPLLAESAALQQALAHLQDFGQPPGDPPLQGEAWFIYLFGFAVLAPLLGLFASTARASMAPRAGIIGIFWVLVLATLLLASMVLATHALDEDLVGRKPEQLPDIAYATSVRGLLLLCGKAVATPAAARAACAAQPGFAGMLAAGDIAVSPLAIVSTLAMVRDPPVAVGSLVLAGLVMAGLALASAGLQTLASALADEGFYRLRDQAAVTSRRLAIARAAMLCAIAGAMAVLVLAAPEARGMSGAALALSAGLVAPLTALALWPLAQTRDALLGLAAGLLFALVRGPAVLAGYDDPGAVAISVAGACLATGLFASLFHAGRTRPRAFFRKLFSRSGEILPPDKGA